MRVKKITSVGFKKDSIVFMLTQEQASGKKKMNIKPPQLIKGLEKTRKMDDFKGKEGELAYFYSGKTLVLLAGLGKEKKLNGRKIRKAVAGAIRSGKLSEHKDVELVPHDREKETSLAAVEGAIIGTYRWKKYVTKEKDDKTVEEKNVHMFLPGFGEFERTVTIAEGVNYARDMVNENADVMDSHAMEKEARKLVRGKKNVDLRVMKEDELKKKGLNLHLAVNMGSKKEPMLIIARYKGGKKKDKFTALVGKGVTFDSGGLNLKPTGYMETMREDMGGSAAVLGTLRNVLEIKPKKNLLFVLGMAENAIGPEAVKPGDVVKSYDGKYVEVANTDAEGRLVLADANAYVTRNYDVGRVINVATLTGAVIVALGYDYSGVMSSRQDMAGHLTRTGEETDDLAWQLPMYDDLKEHVKSKYADIKNVGLSGGAAGTISAGEFLRQFAGDKDWAHVDIAGTAFVDARGRAYYSYGATGSGVRLLTNYVLKHA